MIRSFSLASAVLCTAAAVVGQQCYAPVNAATASLGSSGNYFNSPTVGSMHQSIYDVSHFQAQGLFTPIVINNLEWRLAGGLIQTVGAQTWPNVQVFLGNSATDYLAPSTTFANNRTASQTLVYSGPVSSTVASGSTPNDWVINLPLTTTFLYDPSLGQDLLVEIVLTGPPVPAGVLTLDTAFSVATYKCQAVRATSSNTATVGSLSAFVPSVRFGYTLVPNAATHEPYGEGCYRRTHSFYEIFPGAFPNSTNDLTNTTVRLFPNANGGYDVVTTPGATVVPPTTVGLGLPDDGPSAALPLGFTFPYPGGNSTTDVYAHSNGSVTLNGAGVQFMNNGGTPGDLLGNTRHVLSPSMQDLLCDGATNIQNVYAEPGAAGEYLITWLNVPPFLTVPVASPNLSTFQVALYNTGMVEFRYQTIFNESDSYGGGMLTGFSLGGNATDPGSSDLTATVINGVYPDVSPLTLVGTLRPKLGQPVNYSLVNVLPNAGLSAMLVSFNQLNPGVGLPLYGIPAPGCSAYIDPLANVPFSGLLIGSGTVGFTHTWPVGPWSGVQMFVQGFELAPGQNTVGVLASNGLKAVLDIN